MNKVRLNIIRLMAVMLFPAAGYAQTTGSPYSYFGIGDIDMGNYGENSGMAGLGIGFRQDNTINSANPAALTTIGEKIFIFDGSVFGEYSYYRGQGKHYNSTKGNLQRVALGFLAAKKWTMSLGLVPMSNVGYKINSDFPIEGGMGTRGNFFSGQGGLNKLYWSNAVQISKNFSIGINTAAVFGTIEHVETDNIWMIGRESRGKKMIFDFGAQYTGTMENNTQLTIGAVGGYKTEMKMHNTRLAYNTVYKEVATDEVLPSTEQVLPAFYGIGFSINRKNQLVFGVDYLTQKWSSATSLDAAVRYKDMNKLTAGFSYIPKLLSARTYWQQIKYQAGVTVNDSYLEIGGKTPTNYGVTLGAVFPLRGANMLNFAMEYGKTGLAKSRNGIRENYFKVTFGFALKERWFVPMRYD